MDLHRARGNLALLAQCYVSILRICPILPDHGLDRVLIETRQHLHEDGTALDAELPLLNNAATKNLVFNLSNFHFMVSLLGVKLV
jgi:hypothetical protein